MKISSIIALILSFFLILSAFSGTSSSDTREANADTSKTEQNDTSSSKKKKPKEQKFADVVEDYNKIEGLFTIYHNPKEGKVYMEIRQDQFGPVYLCNLTRQSGDGSLFDSGAMLEEFPFFIQMIGKNVQFVRKNVGFRASKNAAIQKAVEENLPNSIWANAKVASQPHPEIGSILVDASEIFLMDYAMVGHLTTQAKIPYTFDKENSYFSQLKSFPLNSEIQVTLHFKSAKPQPLFTLADSRSMFHRYHYSLSALPESDYQPRIADDRVGHFFTMYQDYTTQLEETPYKYYITRWNLEKSEPRFELSKPAKPVVFWIHKTVPVEYRDAVRKGVLLWNSAFEKIGFQDALEVKQMSDDAEWDPADVRYNTIQWIVQPGGGYAVGPSRANPFTGEIYDADVRVSADYVRFYYREFDEMVGNVSWRDVRTDRLWPDMDPYATISIDYFPLTCNYAQGMSHQMALGWNILLSRNLVNNNPEELKKFIEQGLVDLIVHEVGHTLGLRHNFKASSNIDYKKLSDKNYTSEIGISASVMDYNPVNLAPKGQKQGNYFQTTLGPYDYWAIEYAYKPLDPDAKISEKQMLEKIAQRVADPMLQYGTDEDAYGLSTRGIDPSCSLYDLGNDPLSYYQDRLDISQELWENIPEKFEIEGERYQKFRLVFSQGITEYAIAAANIPRFIGGIHFYRDHIGDPDGRPPFRIVPADRQREALKMLTERFFSPNSFRFSPELLNKLAPQTYWDFEGTPWRRLRVDYPIHGMVQLVQASALFRLYDPLILQRLQDNEVRFPEGEKPFTMAESFQMVRDAIWMELVSGNNINSFRRELQRMHLHILNRILLNEPSALPHDAITLARADMKHILGQIDKRLEQNSLDVYTSAHLEETRAKIEAALKAQVQKSM
ncbi:MAG: DUF5117 domain-containing protein [Calditrichaeota bacterium]|nr:zinc-dependent metalloprotease [Calditrichota bacterium]RQV93549.1 MAG: DUF5117 domain-containing protein [bacterium]RQW06482.1 MAG: DUF5117 domain-containing protein [Calditrichota bacterium]